MEEYDNRRPADEDEDDKWKAYRTFLRTRTTNWSKSVNQCKGDAQITVNSVTLLGDELDKCFNVLGEEARDDEYDKKIGEMKRQLKDEQTRLALATATLSINPPSSSAAPTPPAITIPVIQKSSKLAKPTSFDGNSLSYHTFLKRFESKYDKDPSITPSERFQLFEELVGKHGKDLLRNLNDDADGLRIAKERMAFRFNEEITIRDEVERELNKMSAATNEKDFKRMMENVISCETLFSSLKSCGCNEKTINDLYYRDFAQKFPHKTTSKCLVDHNYKSDVQELITYARTVAESAMKIHKAVGGTFTKKSTSSARINSISTTATESMPSPTTSQNRTPQARSITCEICHGSHRTFHCNAYTPQRRKMVAEGRGLCLRCLNTGHAHDACTSTYLCRYCGEPHSSAICSQSSGSPNINRSPSGSQRGSHRGNTRGNHQPRNSGPRANNQNNLNNNENINNGHQSSISPPTSSGLNAVTTSAIDSSAINSLSVNSDSSSEQSKPNSAVYQTTMIRVKGIPMRVLLDTGAARSFITEAAVKSAKLKKKTAQELRVGGAIGTPTYLLSKSETVATVSSLDNKNSRDIKLRVIKEFSFTHLPALTKAQLIKYKELGLVSHDASAENSEEFPIQIIIGLDLYPAIFGDQPLEDGLYVKESDWGPIFYGVAPQADEHCSLLAVIPLSEHEEPVDKWPSSNIRKFTRKEFDSKIEREYLQDFMANCITFRNGRYTVDLPWQTPVLLGNNRHLARHRFTMLINKLKRNGYYDQYQLEMNTIISKFAERAPAVPTGKHVNYLPHHGVRRDDKETTPLRLVLDGSAHCPGELSLNDNLFKGVNFWNLLSSLLKFRFGTTAFTADIEKAFLMIEVSETDRDALRFWWFDNKEKPVDYRFKVVPFGTSASPFLLMAVMAQHFNSHRQQFPDVVNLIESSFYVDDLIKAMPKVSTEDLNQIFTQIVLLMSLGGMNIRKWRTNNKEIDSMWSPEAKPTVKVLGHLWNLTTDCLSLCFDTSLLNVIVHTKRTWTQIVSSIYDPKGFIAPYVITLRLFLRKLWKEGLDWDEEFNKELYLEAQQLLSDLHLITEPQVPRNVVPDDDPSPELLIFCDASCKAIGAVAYCKSNEQLRLIMAKSKLAREASIPECELDALFMAVELVETLVDLYPFSSVTIFSDSLANLQRLLKNPNSMKSNVALRISKLKNRVTKAATQAKFRHVKSDHNIADVITRGCTMTQLLRKEHWWNGPPIATETRFEESIIAQIQSIPNPATINQQSSNTTCNCTNYSSYNKTFRHYLICAKFLQKIKYKEWHPDRLAHLLMLKACQHKHLSTEIEAIEKANEGKPKLPPNSELKKSPSFLDKNGLLRLKSRLIGCISLTEDQITPIILPSRCSITKLIVQNEHIRSLHAGVDRTFEFVRNRFYMVRGRRIVKSVRRSCRVCNYVQAKTAKVPYGSVPQFRLDQTSPPFTNIGVDLFGPLKVNMTTPGKRYGLIITCATTRAVHLEVLRDMTEHSVFQAFRRCFARFGYPTFIYSDNGSQLKSVRKKLLSYIEGLKKIHPDHQYELSWELQAAIAPWRGGFYERLIGTIKDALQACTFRVKVDDEELRTVMAEVESNLNDRPLFQLDGEVIAPSHFFAGKTLNRLPSVGNNDSRLVKQDGVMDHFRKSRRTVNAIQTAFKYHYLLQLRSFHENVNTPKSPNQLRDGDLVILKNHPGRDSHLPLGRIIKCHISPDGVTRSFDVYAKDHSHYETKKRDIRTLIPLECAFEKNLDNLPDQPFTTGSIFNPKDGCLLNLDETSDLK